jgi:hypothetical protein
LRFRETLSPGNERLSFPPEGGQIAPDPPTKAILIFCRRVDRIRSSSVFFGKLRGLAERYLITKEPLSRHGHVAIKTARVGCCTWGRCSTTVLEPAVALASHKPCVLLAISSVASMPVPAQSTRFEFPKRDSDDRFFGRTRRALFPKVYEKNSYSLSFRFVKRKNRLRSDSATIRQPHPAKLADYCWARLLPKPDEFNNNSWLN